jgi:ubiquitin-activating enzyme E1
VKVTGRLPFPRDSIDADLVYNIAQKLHFGSTAEIDQDLVRELAMQARGNLAPMAAVIGGLVGQEVLKAVSGKFNPIKQFLFFDSLESLPSPPPSADDCAAIGSRYDGQIAVFGKKFQDKLAESSHFLVGAGAM